MTAPHAAIPPAMKDPMVVDMVAEVRLPDVVGERESGVCCAREQKVNSKEWREGNACKANNENRSGGKKLCAYTRLRSFK